MARSHFCLVYDRPWHRPYYILIRRDISLLTLHKSYWMALHTVCRLFMNILTQDLLSSYTSCHDLEFCFYKINLHFLSFRSPPYFKILFLGECVPVWQHLAGKNASYHHHHPMVIRCQLLPRVHVKVFISINSDFFLEDLINLLDEVFL